MGKKQKPKKKLKSKKKNKEVSAEVNEEEEVSDEAEEEVSDEVKEEKDIEEEEKEIVAVNNVIEEENIEMSVRFTNDGSTIHEFLSTYTDYTPHPSDIELGNTASTSLVEIDLGTSQKPPSIDPFELVNIASLIDNTASTSLVDLGNSSIDLGPSQNLGNIASLIDSDLGNTASTTSQKPLIDPSNDFIDIGNIDSDIDLGNTVIESDSTKPDEKPLTVLSEATIETIEIGCCAKIKSSPGDYLLNGSITVGEGMTIESSFIKCSQLQCQNFEKLRKLGSASPHFLTPFQIVVSHSQRFLAVEPVETVQAFFRKKFQSFSSDNTTLNLNSHEAVELWWKTIKDDFYIIFRNVVSGLMFHRKKQRYSCGDLERSIFVLRKSEIDDDAFEIRGKLMPSLTESKIFIAEVNQLKAIMESIIYPQPLPYVYTPSCFEVDQFLDFISLYSNFSNACFLWIVNHPFLWSSTERVLFMKELGSLHKAKRKIIAKLGKHLYNRFGPKIPWTSLVKDPLLVAILKKPDSSNIACYNDRRADGIIRFFGACYSHANETEYLSQRQGKYLSDEEIEEKLNATFPYIYVWIKEGLLLQTKKNHDVEYLLENWPRR